MSLRTSIAFFILSMLFFNHQIQAQVIAFDVSKADLIKDGTTYVIANDSKTPKAQQYLEAMGKDWKLTKGLQFLTPESQPNAFSANDTFLMFCREVSSFQTNRTTVTNIYYSFSLATLSEKFLKGKSKEKLEFEHMAYIPLRVGVKAFKVKDHLDTISFDGGGLLVNWSPGMAKNYLQQMTGLMAKKQQVSWRKENTNMQELAKLANDTLYIADFNLMHINIFSGKEYLETDDHILKAYGYNYKKVTKDELDRLILNADKPLYYFLFIKDSTRKIISVINAQTGENIYCRITMLGYNLKSSDLKELYKKVKKGQR
ncbi:hypothetical protein VRU48_17955 [Pedobacter sp. KR3-3]|uniref:Uncharacterized protein n=1 Tax=Pedobacter albus TaxID=3113905 RepID=A0ABU7ICE2_9SPHI|nr:hypothetical protein [Pedobacter sp. KR3-3]MEE1947014.1 hypothetical protein [Pedobacter sp. KR3-3]